MVCCAKAYFYVILNAVKNLFFSGFFVSVRMTLLKIPANPNLSILILQRYYYFSQILPIAKQYFL